jgi:O-antigen ligase
MFLLFSLYLLSIILITLYILLKREFDVALIFSTGMFWVVNGAQFYSSTIVIGQVILGTLIFLRIIGRKQTEIESAGVALELLYFALALTVIISYVFSSQGITGAIRFLLIAILVIYLKKLDRQIIIKSTKYLSIVTLIGVLSIFVSNTPRQSYGVGLNGNQSYPNLLGHPNYLAYIASILVLIFMSPIFANRTLQLVLPIAAFSTIVHSEARTPFIACLIGVILTLISPKNRRFRKIRAQGLPRLGQLLFLSTLPLLTFISGVGLLGRLTELNSDSGGLLGNNSFGWRWLQWDTALSLSRENFLTGIGWQNSSQYLLSGLKAHNSFVQILLELGVFAFLLFVTINLLILKNFSKSTHYVGLISLIGLSSLLDGGLLYPAIVFFALLLLNLERVGRGVELKKTFANPRL